MKNGPVPKDHEERACDTVLHGSLSQARPSRPMKDGPVTQRAGTASPAGVRCELLREPRLVFQVRRRQAGGRRLYPVLTHPLGGGGGDGERPSPHSAVMPPDRERFRGSRKGRRSGRQPPVGDPTRNPNGTLGILPPTWKCSGEYLTPPRV
eukprot:gene17405-biopygen3854